MITPVTTLDIILGIWGGMTVVGVLCYLVIGWLADRRHRR
jgi:hypothetical protein